MPGRMDMPSENGAVDEGRVGSRIADVVVPVALDKAYSYAVPAGTALAEGDIVVVPLGPRETVGVVWALRDGAAANLKSVLGRVDVPPMGEDLRRLIDWIAWYTLAPLGLAMRLALRIPGEDRTEQVRVGVRLAGEPPERLTAARHAARSRPPAA